VGRLAGFRFVKDADVDENRAVAAAAHRVLGDAMARRVHAFASSPESAFTLGVNSGPGLGWGELGWNGEQVARLVTGVDVLRPGLKLVYCEHLSGPQRERVRVRLDNWLRAYIDRLAAPLRRIEAAPLTGTARGLAFQIVQSLGAMPRATVRREVQALSKTERRSLKALGITLGSVSVHVPAMLKASLIGPKILLKNVFQARYAAPDLPKPAAVSLSLTERADGRFDAIPGFIVLGSRAMRADMVERLATELRRRAQRGPIAADRSLLLLAHCKKAELSGVLSALGYAEKKSIDGTASHYVPVRRRAGKRKARGSRAGTPPLDPHSPFALLRELSEKPAPQDRSPRR